MNGKNSVITAVLLLTILLAAACGPAEPTRPPTAEGATPAAGQTPATGEPATEVVEPAVPTPEADTPSAPTSGPVAPTAAADTPAASTPGPDGGLPALHLGTSAPFAQVELVSWTPRPYAGMDYPLPLDLDLTVNPQVLAGLTEEQRVFLAQNGMVVIHSQEAQFSVIRDAMLAQGQPYFFTTDAALHVLHLTFDELLKALEREQLYPQMAALIRAMLGEVVSSIPAAEGTPLEQDTLLAGAYLSVALRLFDPQAEVDPRLEPAVTAQLAQIAAGDGRGCSVLIPSFEDDYGAYRPVGHYAGDPDLERYFGGMTWLGRVHFKLSAEPTGGNCPPPAAVSRAPLILTLALRRAQVGERPAAELWARIHEVLTFMIGPSDDGGPAEVAPLMDQVYGTNLTMADLADEALWAAFLDRRGELPVPQINSTFVDWVTEELPVEVGWRLMGQRFTLDGLVMQKLIFDEVDPAADGELRLLPTGLDVMAALGSEVADGQLGAQDQARFPNYFDQLALLRQGIGAQPEREWLLRAYDAWLYTLMPILQVKDASYPPTMRTRAWGYRELNSALGSWAELKHDTVLYAKMPEAAGGGGPPTSPPPPGYGEANPNAFYRMAYVAQTLVDGLQARDMVDESQGFGSGGLGALLWRMGRLGVDFRALGDIAVKELAGVPLDEADREVLFRGGLAPFEDIGGRELEQEPDPPPVVAAVAGSGSIGDEVLEVATGYVDRIYVVVPIDGELSIAQGGIYSYYEFAQPRSERLTDQAWRERLAGPDAPPLPPWSANFLLPGGGPADWLVFRVGDAFWVNEAGDAVNLRDAPSLTGTVVAQLSGDSGFAARTYFEIIDGPAESDGFRWWQVRVLYPDQVGWLVEDQTWYNRSY